MAFWGKIIGGAAGFVLGGPPGLVVGATLGHAADSGGMKLPFGADPSLAPAKVAAMLGRREQLFAIDVVVLAAKLARCDGPIKRVEIDTFKRHFSIPPEAEREIGRLFDRAREKPDLYLPYAEQLGVTFADTPDRLEAALQGLFAIARCDGPINKTELAFLQAVHRAFGLNAYAWERASGASPAVNPGDADPYAVLGVPRDIGDKQLRDAWRQLMRENHPDSLIAQGASQAIIDSTSEKVARINAAWDRVKRERGL